MGLVRTLKLLEIFSGTHSVGDVARDLGWDVTSLDLKDADICTDILRWPYWNIQPNTYDVIWASPPCESFSTMQLCWIGRVNKNSKGGKTLTRADVDQGVKDRGLPLLECTWDIINHFQPTVWYIENPRHGGSMKDQTVMQGVPYYDVDYCRYANFGYQKPTRIWTNLAEFDPLICNK